MQKNTYDIVIFLVVVSALILVMITFIITIIYLYRKRQITFVKKTEILKADYEKNLLAAKLEIQEQTFQNISREIHDNITLSLTLAKLYLNTIDWKNEEQSTEKIQLSVGLVSESIRDLSDISRSLNADLIIHHGLTKALEDEVQHIQKTGLFTIDCKFIGNLAYMDTQRELIIFRVIQETFNNIIKHAKANYIEFIMNYNSGKLNITVRDNGIGFNFETAVKKGQAGLKNMETRIKMLQGSMAVITAPAQGTTLSFTIPFE